MQAYSKAIAALVSSFLAVLVTFNLISPELAARLGEGLATIIDALFIAVLTAGAVFFAPKNGKEDKE